MRSQIVAALFVFSSTQLVWAEEKTPEKKVESKADGKAAAPGASEEAVVEAVECTHGKEVRRLEVHTKEAGCTLHYAKSGKTSQIANANHGVELCQSNLKKVRETLEKGGYSCK
jgi:hypothetical protein